MKLQKHCMHCNMHSLSQTVYSLNIKRGKDSFYKKEGLGLLRRWNNEALLVQIDLKEAFITRLNRYKKEGYSRKKKAESMRRKWQWEDYGLLAAGIPPHVSPCTLTGNHCSHPHFFWRELHKVLVGFRIIFNTLSPGMGTLLALKVTFSGVSSKNFPPSIPPFIKKKNRYCNACFTGELWWVFSIKWYRFSLEAGVQNAEPSEIQ